MENCTLNMWRVMEILPEAISKDQFLKAVDIWNNNPRSVNQRVHSSIVVLKAKLADGIQNDLLIPKILLLKSDVSEFSPEEFHGLIEELGLAVSSDGNSSSEIVIKKLLPKSTKHFSVSFELVITDLKDGWALFAGLPVRQGVPLVPKFPYRVYYKTSITLEILHNQEANDPSFVWLKNHLLPQLQKWALSHRGKDDSENCDSGLPMKSHALISTEKYAEVYQNLKMKYGQQMVKIWPECTDPAKYVYEDVAIASYILLLWGGKKSVSFVDLGCGNGLLVHILNSEGHNGIGIDLRSRKIWDLYPKTTKLEVRSITPSDDSLFPETDWLIGNHSDELTPWIPVIAARSSQTCNFFVLPCCPYDFDGLKYRRKNSVLSQYSDFLLYVKQISEKCGFKTDIDRMRIPSTKRICLVGQGRTYASKEWGLVNSTINQMIDNGCRRKPDNQENKVDTEACGDNEWVSDFKPREATERVRNCTQLEEDLVSDIVSLTAKHLLVKRRMIPCPHGPDKTWNAGGIAAFSEIIPLIGAERLKQLKSECGGLQTLLKNHHQVFLVEKGRVQLRSPILLSNVVSNGKIRVQFKPCWFFHNHPDGCLLQDSECAFKH